MSPFLAKEICRKGREKFSVAQADRARAIVRPAIRLIAYRSAGFNFTALLEGGFARKFDATFVVDADAFYPNHFADLRDILDTADPEIGQLGNMHETVFAREHFDKRAELF